MRALVERLQLFGSEPRHLEILVRNDAQESEITNHGRVGCMRRVRPHGFGESGEERARLHRFDTIWRHAARASEITILDHSGSFEGIVRVLFKGASTTYTNNHW
jgi:hypothetical protein